MLHEKQTIGCFDKFAPKKKFSLKLKPTRVLSRKLETHWSNAIASAENRLKSQNTKIISTTKIEPNNLTQKVRLAKKEGNFKALGPNPIPNHSYQNFKNILQQLLQFCTVLSDLHPVNNYYVCWSSSKLPINEKISKIIKIRNLCSCITYENLNLLHRATPVLKKALSRLLQNS